MKHPSILRSVLLIVTLLALVSCAKHTARICGLDANYPPSDWSAMLQTNIEPDSYDLVLIFKPSAPTNNVSISRKYYPGWPHVKVIETTKIVNQSARLTISSNDMALVYKHAIGCLRGCVIGRQAPYRSGFEVG